MSIELDSLLSDFVSEALELLQKAETRIMELEESYDTEKINSLFRAFHTIKGNSGMFGFSVIQELSHKAEEVLDAVRSGEIDYQKEIADSLLKTIDRLKQIIDDIQNEASYNVKDICDELLSLKTHFFQTKQKENFSQTVEEETLETRFSSEIAKAKELKKNLYYYLFDFLESSKKTTSELVEILHQNKSQILRYGIVWKSLPSLKDKKISLPFDILVISNETSEKFEKKLGLKPKEKTLLYSYQPTPTENKHKVQEEVKATDNYLRVKIDLLDELIKLVGETIITRNQLLQRSQIWNDPEGTSILSQLSQLITQLHTKIMSTRLQELNTVYQRISRIVRDTSHALGKKVELYLEGGEVELDKTMIDTILDALVHIIRNAVDHGIELPQERVQKGKPEEGKIIIRSSLQTGNVRIQVQDDGRGLDLEKIKQVAFQKGLISEEKLQDISQEELIEFIFLPGFSTKQEATQTSGRGVGMDAIRNGLKKIGGTIHLSTVVGEGTKIVATIPQTVSVISCLLVSVYGRRFAIFQKYISELLQFDKSHYTFVNGHGMYQLREYLVPIIDLGKLLYNVEDEKKQENSYIVVIKLDNYYFGLLFDEMIGTEEIVIKPLGEHLKDIKLFSGATIMGDGEVVLILDVFGVANYCGIHTIEVQFSKSKEKLKLSKEQSFVLYESSGQLFATPSVQIQSIEQINKEHIFHISDLEVFDFKGDIIPIQRLEEIYKIVIHEYEEENYIILCKIERRKIGVLIHKVIDVIENLELVESSSELRGEGIIGQALYQEKPVLIVDLIALLTKVNKLRFQWLGKNLEKIQPTVSLIEDVYGGI